MPCFFKCCFGGSKSNEAVVMDPPQPSYEQSPLLGLKEELIKKTCALAFKAHKSPKKHYYLVEMMKRNSNLEADLVISFPGSWAANDWFASKPYGATKINHTLFPSIKSVGLDESALVNHAFQMRFESILMNSSLKQESTRARLCLRATGELQKRQHENEKRISKEIKKAEATVKDLKQYKEKCETRKRYYYDAFKAQDNEVDFEANVKRLVMAEVWDEIIEMLRKYELPDEFEGRPAWIKVGTEFRRLVEPLDIANYYRHSKDKDAGPYMDKGRPRRYRYTQRWLEHSERITRPKEAYSESCFWAEFEELCKINFSSKILFEEDVMQKVVRLEAQIKAWIEKDVLDKGVLLEGSTFVKWWKTLPPQHKKGSCIRILIESET